MSMDIIPSGREITLLLDEALDCAWRERAQMRRMRNESPKRPVPALIAGDLRADDMSPPRRTRGLPFLADMTHSDSSAPRCLVYDEDWEVWELSIAGSMRTYLIDRRDGRGYDPGFKVGNFPNQARTLEFPRYYAKLKQLKKIPRLMKDLEPTRLFEGIFSPTSNVYRSRFVVAIAFRKNGYTLQYVRNNARRGNGGKTSKTINRVVHHKDENSLNDSIFNLLVTTPAQHNKEHNKSAIGYWEEVNQPISDLPPVTRAVTAPVVAVTNDVEDTQADSTHTNLVYRYVEQVCGSEPVEPSTSRATDTASTEPAVARSAPGVGAYLDHGKSDAVERGGEPEPFAPLTDEERLTWVYHFQHTRRGRQVRVLQAWAEAFLGDVRLWNNRAARRDSTEWRRLQALAPNWHLITPGERYHHQRKLGVAKQPGVVFRNGSSFGFRETPEVAFYPSLRWLPRPYRRPHQPPPCR